MSERAPRLALSGLLGVALAWYAARIVAPVVRTSNLADDYRQAAIWLVQAHAGHVFEHDPLTAYARGFQPPVLAALDEAAARVVDPSVLGKIVSLAAWSAFVVATAAIGRRVAGPTGGLVLAFLAITDLAWTRAIFGGIARSYAPALVAGMVWAVVARRPIALAALAGLAGMLHPQSMLLGVSIALLSAAMGARRRRRFVADVTADRPPSRWSLLAMLGVAAACVAGNGAHERWMESRFGPMYGRAAFLALPELERGGRWANERPDGIVIDVAQAVARHLGFLGRPFAVDRGESGATRWIRSLGLLLAVGAALEALRRTARASWTDVPRIVVGMAIVSIAWRTVAAIVLPRIYFPRRYVDIVGPLALQTCLAVFLARWLDGAASDDGLRAGRARRALPCALVAVLGVAGGWIPAHERFPAYWVSVKDHRDVARFLASTPVETVFAARPEGDADTLAALVPRCVYVAREIGHPLFSRYLEDVIRPRTLAAWRAIFPEEPERDVGALRAGGVDLLVLRREDLRDSAPLAREIDEPYRAQVMSGWTNDAARRRADYWRSHASAIVYRDSRFVVVELARL